MHTHTLLVDVGLKPDDTLAIKLWHKVVPELGLLVSPVSTNCTKKVDHHVCYHPRHAATICGPDHLHNPSIEAMATVETEVSEGNLSLSELTDHNGNMYLDQQVDVFDSEVDFKLVVIHLAYQTSVDMSYFF